MHAVLWWLFTYAALISAIETGRRLGRKFDVWNSSKTVDSLKQATGVVATLTALVLGLLIANGQKAFEQESSAISSIAVDVARLDQKFVEFGESANVARSQLHLAIGPILYSLWDSQEEADFSQDSRARNEQFRLEILNLPEDTNQQKRLKSSIYEIADELLRARIQLATLENASIPGVLLTTLFLWTFIVFLGMSICADQSRISRTALYLGAASTATAVFLIMEYETPFSGFVQISRNAVDVMAAAISSD